MRRGMWVGAALLAACGPPAPGTVLGDAFLVEDVGREVNLAGLQVRLLADDPQLDSTLARICPGREADPADPVAAHARALGQRRRLLQTRVRATAVAAPAFRFDTVAPGRYRVWADTVVGSVRWSWLHPVTVAPGDTVRVELSNANPDENPFRCSPRADGPTEMKVK